MGDKSIAAQTLGQMGGWATRKKYGNDHFKKISQLAAKARQEKAAKKKLLVDTLPSA